MNSESFRSAYDHVMQGCGSIARAGHAWVVVSGRDRASYLQGLLTNDISALAEGTGCYSAYLTPQGRMISDMAVYELGDVILLALPASTRETVIAKLDQFIFSEDVQLGDVSTTFAGLSLVGPESAAVAAKVASLDPQTIEALPLYGNVRATFDGSPCIVLRVGDRGALAFDLLVESARYDALDRAAASAGASPVAADVLEAIRVEAGIPLFPQDMNEDIIPLEAGIESRAISFNKGCYVGQEVIIRVLHRGHGRVAKKLVGLVLDGAELPAVGAPIERENKAPGIVTSVAWSPRLERGIALGYVHRDLLEPGTEVRIGDRQAIVSALPFHQ